MAEETRTADVAADGAADGAADVAELSYEEARDELAALVARLEGGQVPLEESMRLWQRGEELAARCAAWLDRAEATLRGEESPAGSTGPAGDEDA